MEDCSSSGIGSYRRTIPSSAVELPTWPTGRSNRICSTTWEKYKKKGCMETAGQMDNVTPVSYKDILEKLLP